MLLVYWDINKKTEQQELNSVTAGRSHILDNFYLSYMPFLVYTV